MAPQVGLEPTTLWLTVRCSTDWAIEEYWSDLSFLQIALCRHRPIFPGRHQPSIVSVNELNYRVRNGNGCTLITINTYYFGLHFCTLKTEQRWTRQKHFSEFTQIKFRSSPRPISISPLHTLLYFHSWPINHIVYVGSYFRRMGNLILRGVSRLDAFSVYLVQT